MDDDTTTDDTTVDTEQDTTEENISVESARKLRSEAKGLRDRAKAAEALADDYARRLFAARVSATGLVANPAEIPFNGDLLDDDDALNTAIETAITERPYIRSRKAAGIIGQGVKGDPTVPQDFSSLFSRT